MYLLAFEFVVLIYLIIYAIMGFKHNKYKFTLIFLFISTNIKSKKLTILFKLWTNKNHSYKHNEQINNQNIDNSECFGVKFVKIYSEMTSQ